MRCAERKGGVHTCRDGRLKLELVSNSIDAQYILRYIVPKTVFGKIVYMFDTFTGVAVILLSENSRSMVSLS
jgi:hypothetical protein